MTLILLWAIYLLALGTYLSSSPDVKLEFAGMFLAAASLLLVVGGVAMLVFHL